ncbi:hypothetical protein C8R47DRAFT_1064391 [Mycena vitilis]|nr:hypothetical protein C8R47DRAFT_1064391 [Mycena vitilis]
MVDGEPTRLWILLQSLPTELLSLVLLLATRRDVLSANKSAKRRRALCLVAKQWSIVLYDTPQAWRTYSVVLGTAPTQYTMSTWLKNSRSTDKNVSVEIRNDSPITPDGVTIMTGFIRSYLSVLAPYFHRVAAFRIICPITSVSELAFAHLSAMDCGRLRELYIDLNLSMDPIIVRERPPFSSALPVLRGLYTSRCFPPNALRFAGGTVTDMRLSSIVYCDTRWETMVDTLSAFPKIRNLKLGGVLCALYPQNARQVVFNRLTHLSVSCFVPSMVYPLRHISTPSLSHLRLVLRDPVSVETLIDVFRPRMMQVDSLDLCIKAVLSADLTSSLLASFMRVASVDMSDCAIECRSALLEALRNKLVILPRLSRINLGWQVPALDRRSILGDRRFAPDCRLVLWLSCNEIYMKIPTGRRPDSYCHAPAVALKPKYIALTVPIRIWAIVSFNLSILFGSSNYGTIRVDWALI